MRILLLDTCPDFRRITGSFLREMGHDCLAQHTCRAVLSKLKNHEFDVLLFDLQSPDRQGNGLELIPRFLAADNEVGVVALSALSSVTAAVEALQAGAIDYLPKPLATGSLVRCLNRIEDKRFSGKTKVARPQSSRPPLPEGTFETEVPCMREVFDLVTRAAATPTTLLLLGESGTGKTTLARAIHCQSREKQGPFVTVNCPSLSKELFESDLFGHVRGAFTGAVSDKPGKVAHAAGGTLFLDEIGELPLQLQPKLLRLIQEREYERVGDPATLTAHVRVIAATNKDLGKEVREGRFREDLFYRLNVVPIHVPALRDRIGDLPGLAKTTLRNLVCEMGKPDSYFSNEAINAIRHYGWPGNLRELRNALEHALIMSTGGRIEVAHFPAYLNGQESKLNRCAKDCQVGSLVSLEALERAQIEHILEVTTSREEAATILGIDPTTLYRKRKRYSEIQPEMAESA